MIALVTDVHYRMAPALIRALGQQGVAVYTCEKEGAAILPGARSKYAKKHFPLPENDYENALYALAEQLGRQHGCKPALLPMGAATLQMIAKKQDRFSQVAGLCLADPAALELLNSKRALHELAAELKIPIPRATESCPCVVKPVCGEKLGLHAAERYRICHTPAEQQVAIAHFEALAGEPPVVQEYLPGSGSGCSIIADQGKVIAWIGHRRLREYPISGGPSSCCIATQDAEVLQWVEKLVAATHFSGPAMFEFKEGADGKPRLLECNPRIWGSFPLTYAAGSTLAYAWFAAAGGLEIPENKFRAGKKMIFFPSDSASGLGYLKKGQLGRALGTVADFWNPRVSDGLFCWRDPAPAFAYYAGLFRRGGEK